MKKYRCSNCSAEDSDHQTYTDHPAALICWNCREGRQVQTVVEQLRHMIGMLPVNDPE